MDSTEEQQPKSQAEAIIDRFGNPRRLAEAMLKAGVARDAATIYKWTYPKDKGGTGGYIPSSAHDDVKKAARAEGILLRASDWFPEAPI